MTENETLFLIYTVVTCSIAFGIGFTYAFFNGYFEYKKTEYKIKNCKHETFVKSSQYTHTIYNSDLNKSNTVYKFSCANCGLVKYKAVIEEKD